MNGINSSPRELLRIGLRHAVLGLYSVVVLFPILWVVSMSLKPKSALLKMPPQIIFIPTLENYVQLSQQTGFIDALFNSIFMVSVSVVLVLLVGVPAAYSLSRYEFRYERDILIWILSTRMLPPIAVVIPFFVLFRTFNLYDSYIGMIIMYMTINISLVVWVMKSFFDGIPSTLEEAAMIDGATRTQALVKVIIPTAFPGIIAVSIISFIFAWIELIFSLILTTDKATTAPLQLYQYIGVRNIEWGMLAAASTLLFLPVLALVLLVNDHLASGLSFGVTLKE